MARDVFISYRSEDKESADRLCAALERENISCWMAPRDIPAGGEWAMAIVEGIQRSHCFVLVLSANSQNARQISREAELADHQGLPIITFRIEDVQPPPGLLYFLGNVQWLDAFAGQFEAALARLTEVVRQNASYPAPKTTIRKSPDYMPAAPAPAVPAAPAPVATPQAFPPPAPPSPGTLFSATRIGIAVAAVVFLAAAGWLIARRSNDHSQPNRAGETEAAAEAERFLNYRDSGDLQAAWKQFTPENQARMSERQWSENVRAVAKKNGEVRSHRFERCTIDAAGTVYTCYFTLLYPNNFSAQNKIEVAKTGDGSWGISSTSRNAPQ